MANALTQFSRDLAATIDATSPAIVAVHGRGRLPSSGIVWEPGLVVTAEETVARDADLALTLADGRRVEATLAGRDPSTDIAVLRFAGEARPIAHRRRIGAAARPSRRRGRASRARRHRRVRHRRARRRPLAQLPWRQDRCAGCVSICALR